jgi:hypothetical protein
MKTKLLDTDLALVTGSFTICQACLNGEGGECHSPGCLFFLCRAPDLPIGETLRMFGVCVDEEPGFFQAD